MIFDECDYLCVLLAHNNVCIYNVSSECYQSICCEERCILYPYIYILKQNVLTLILTLLLDMLALC